jgi:histidinol-phosphate aminotransferase
LLPMDKLTASAARRVRWVALANPNNPTGTLISKRDLKALLEVAPEALVLVDEAYFDFSGMTVLPWIRRYPNLIVSRTFSKAYGLAALRIGFLLARKELTDAMRKCHAVYAVNSAAVCAATEAIRHLGDVQRYSRMIIDGRRRFCQHLDRMGIAYAPSLANFVLARFGSRADEIAAHLREGGILVRAWSEDRTLKEYLRISIGTPPQMRRLVEALDRLRALMEKPSPQPPSPSSLSQGRGKRAKA